MQLGGFLHIEDLYIGLLKCLNSDSSFSSSIKNQLVLLEVKYSGLKHRICMMGIANDFCASGYDSIGNRQ